MLRKSFATLFVVCSLTACKSGPRISPCFIGVPEAVCYCAPAGGGAAVEYPLQHCDGYTALSPDDMQTLVEWIKRRTGRNE